MYPAVARQAVKIYGDRFNGDMRKKSCTVWGGETLGQDVQRSCVCSVIRNAQGQAERSLGNTVWGEMSLFAGGEVGQMIFKSPKLFVILSSVIREQFSQVDLSWQSVLCIPALSKALWLVFLWLAITKTLLSYPHLWPDASQDIAYQVILKEPVCLCPSPSYQYTFFVA